jgi:hypothetical protein
MMAASNRRAEHGTAFCWSGRVEGRDVSVRRTAPSDVAMSIEMEEEMSTLDLVDTREAGGRVVGCASL